MVSGTSVVGASDGERVAGGVGGTVGVTTSDAAEEGESSVPQETNAAIPIRQQPDSSRLVANRRIDVMPTRLPGMYAARKWFCSHVMGGRRVQRAAPAMKVDTM